MEPGSLFTREAIHHGRDPRSGAAVKQLTSGPGIHMNIYYEVPYTDASSRWFVYIKAAASQGPYEVWRADLQRDWLEPLSDGALYLAGMAVSPDQKDFYCVRPLDDEAWELVRTDIATFEQRVTTVAGLPKARSLGTVAPDGAYFVSVQLGPGRYGIAGIDPETGAHRLLHEGPEICNAHPQVEPGRGEVLLIQHNRGCEFDERGKVVRLVGEQGATLYLIDRDGAGPHTLPLGKPDTLPCQGHQCWIGETGEILLTVTGAGTRELRQRGCLLAIHPGDEAARVVARGYTFSHAGASKDGRFFVSDTVDSDLGRVGWIVVGSLKTGRTRVLCQSGATFGGAQYTHTHPYFTPDCRWVIFNSNRTGLPHVWAATVPDGLLESLES